MILSSSSYANQQCQNLFKTKEVRRDSFDWLEKNNAKVDRFIKDQNGLTFNDLKNLNIKGVERLLRKIMDVPSISAHISLRSHSEITIQDQGIAKPKDVVLTHKNGAREVLFNSFQWKRNGTFNFVASTLSPGERYLTVTAAENGTIDDFRVIVYDLMNRRMLTDSLSTTHKKALEVDAAHDSTVVWLNESQFALSSESGVLVYDIKDVKGQAEVSLSQKNSGSVIGSKAGLTIINVDGNDFYYQYGKPTMTATTTSINTIIGTVGTDIYLLGHGVGRWGEIIKGTRRLDDPTKLDLSVILPETNWVTDRAFKLDNTHLALSRYYGSNRRIEILDLSTNMITQTIAAPPSSSFSNLKWKTPGTQLEMILSSPIIQAQRFTFDFTSQAYLEGDPEIAMMTLDGVQYVTEYLQIASKDGTLVPTRIVHVKDLARDGSASGLSWTYGGFGLNGYLYPSFNALNLEYIKRGGVLIAPGVRGGSEKGEQWHLDGRLDKKQNGIDDLIFTIKYLQTQKYISPLKTISTGWSNGGLMVAAAALQAPEVFALVSPGGGVHDTKNTMREDKRFNGWSYEFGNASSADWDNFMKDWSPVNLAKLGTGQGPIYLNIAGRNDSRVNHVNTLKFTFGQQKYYIDPSRVRMISLNNAGHWMTSQLYQDVIALESQSQIWSYFFATAGMSVDE